MSEDLILNPIEFTPTLPEVSLTNLGLDILANPGPDYGESSVTVQRVKKAISEGITDGSWPPVECTIPLKAFALGDSPIADPWHRLEAWVGEVQKKHTGWIRRDFDEGAGFSGSVGCFVDSAGMTPPQGWEFNHLDVIPDLILKFSRYPIWFATVEQEVAESRVSGTRSIQLELAELLGTAPGLIRVAVKNEGTEDWRACLVSIECDDYSAEPTAAAGFRAESLTPKGGATVGGGVVKCPVLTPGWQTVLGSEIAGVGHMTHVGPRRMIFRMDGGPVLGDVQWKLEWRALGAAAWVQTLEGSTPIVRSSPTTGGLQLIDLGECRPERAVTGEQRWEWRLQARSLAGATARPLIRSVYPMSTEQWLRVSDSTASPVDGEPTLVGGSVTDATGIGSVEWKPATGGGPMSLGLESKLPTVSLEAGETSHYLEVADLGFEEVLPEGADILGVSALARPADLVVGKIEETRVRLIVGGVVKAAEDKARPFPFPYWASGEARSWGGPEDLWGLASLDRAEVIASDFGAAIALSAADLLPEVGAPTPRIKLGVVTLTVAYSEGGNENRICFASRSVEFTDSGARRQHATDEIWGDLDPAGMLLTAPVPGQAGQVGRALIIPSVGDLATRADVATISATAAVTCRPGYLFAREAAGDAPPRFSTVISGWGNSLDWGSVGGIQFNWIALLGEVLGVPAFNFGIPGQSSTDIAMRQGGVRPKLTVVGNTIPAGVEPVEVTAFEPATSYRPNSGKNFKTPGVLAGVPGILEHNHGTHLWNFTRSVAGAAVPCPPGTPYYGTEGEGHQGDLQIFWAGRNNIAMENCLPSDAVRDIKSMIRHQSVGKRYLVLGETTTDSETTGTTGHAEVVELNRSYGENFANRYIPVRDYLIQFGLEDAGINPTAEDLSRIANDTIPAGLWSEGPHLSEAGYKVVCGLVAQKIRELGWVEDAAPLLAPAKATNLKAGTVTEETVALTWSAAARATGYRVECRKVGDTAWVRCAISAEGKATVGALTPGTEYEFRVIPRNVAGYGESTTVVKATTEGGVPVMITSDSFNRAEGPPGTTDCASGGSPKAFHGSNQVKIKANTLGRPSPTGTQFEYIDVGATDCRHESVIVALPAEGKGLAGIYCRFTDTTHFYAAHLDNTGRVYLERYNGASTKLAESAAGAVKAGDRLAIRARGNKIQVYVNGTVLIPAVEDNALTTGTIVGWRFPSTDPNVAYDNLMVTDR